MAGLGGGGGGGGGGVEQWILQTYIIMMQWSNNLIITAERMDVFTITLRKKHTHTLPVSSLHVVGMFCGRSPN